MNGFFRIIARLSAFGAALGVVAVAVLIGGYYYVEPSLPEAVELRDVQFQRPLIVYSRDGRVIARFGEQRRTPVPYSEIPEKLIQAIVAAEDDRFFEHSGMDLAVTVRAVFNYITRPGENVPGGSTITQQIPRTMDFLSRDRSLVRKFKEWILAFRIESEFEKEEILELFLNTTFFGQRSFGIYATAQTYFNKSLDELTLSEIAIIAGIPQGPSVRNPYNSPDNARIRRTYVLRRMHELGYITSAEREAALAEPIVSRLYGRQTDVEADYVAEMVRLEMVRRYGQAAAYTSGFKVTTTVDSRLQRAANESVTGTLVDYDLRHGYRGAIGRVDLARAAGPDGQLDLEQLAEIMADYGSVMDLDSGLVLAIEEPLATVFLPELGVTQIGLDSVAWARPYLSETVSGEEPRTVSDVLNAGDIVRFRRAAGGELRLAQLPVVQGAFVSLDPRDGAIVALSGGLDYFLNNYNRATQALRQPGSSFKPFVYSAALENGHTLATIINDAPIVEESSELEKTWRPENFSGLGVGETPLRRALKESMNLAAIRTLRNVGVRNAISHLRRFGFNARATPEESTLALGAGNLAPLDLAQAYTVLANGGYAVAPYFIQRIEDADGAVLYDASKTVSVVCRSDGTEVTAWCEETVARAEAAKQRPAELVRSVSELYPPYRHAKRAVSAQNVFLITDILRDVIASGSGNRAAREMRRRDIAGKTGTTNGPTDAWFAGFNADIVGVAWVGFDDNRSMGNREQGGVTAIPMWIHYMTEALAGQPEHLLARPPGIVEVRVNPDTGLVASDANPNAHWEMFQVGTVPARESDAPYLRRDLGQGIPELQTDAPIF
jgi:penicillin-binding protein 1A